MKSIAARYDGRRHVNISWRSPIVLLERVATEGSTALPTQLAKRLSIIPIAGSNGRVSQQAESGRDHWRLAAVVSVTPTPAADLPAHSRNASGQRSACAPAVLTDGPDDKRSAWWRSPSRRAGRGS